MIADYFQYSNLLANLLYIVAVLFLILRMYFNTISSNFFCIENNFIITWFVIPLIIMMPFSYSSLNYYASPDYYYYRHLVSTAVSISCFGIISFVLGLFFSNKLRLTNQNTHKLILLSSRVFWFGFNNWFLRIIFISILFLNFLYLLIITGVNFGSGRSFAMENTGLRPVINTLLVVIGYYIIYSYSYAIEKNRIRYYMFSVIFLIMAMFFGTRSSIIMPIIFIVFLKFFVDDKKINLLSSMKIFFISFILIYLALFISNFRNDSSGLLLMGLLYGNNYSDLRDFAWVLYGWNGEFLLGKTQLAGILSFIPSSFSDFRQNWSWGVFSTTINGLDSSVHPGLRAGYFGESYINFGIFGVFLIGFLSGFFVGKYNQVLAHFLKNKDRFLTIRIYALGSIFLSVLSCFAITAGFFSIYVLLVIFVLFGVLRALLISK